MINSVFRKGNNYYPQVFLEECKYVVKEKNISKHIIDGIEISSYFDRENFDGETSDEDNSDEESFCKKILTKTNNFQSI